MKKILLIVLGIIVAFAALAHDMDSSLVHHSNFDRNNNRAIQNDDHNKIEGTDLYLADKNNKSSEE